MNSRAKILIVDDEPDIRIILEKYISRGVVGTALGPRAFDRQPCGADDGLPRMITIYGSL